jgi:hypothetical protein
VKRQDTNHPKQEHDMMRTIAAPAILAGLLALLTAAQVHAYGAVHTGYTAVGPNGGVAHVGSTTAVGPYGGVAHTSSAVGVGPYGGAYGERTTAYSPSMYNGYSAVGHTVAVPGSVVHSTTIYP